MRSATIRTLPLRVTLGMTALASLMFAAPEARANILNVSANVAADCSVQAGSLDFGAYNPSADKNVTGLFTVTCSVDAEVTIGLDQGQTFDGFRNLVNGGTGIRYVLYQDSARTTEWGDASSHPGPKRTVNIQGGNTPRDVEVFGTLVVSGAKPAGEYSDVVNITFSVN